MPQLEIEISALEKEQPLLCVLETEGLMLCLLRTSCPIGDNVFAFHIDWKNLKLFSFWNQVKIWLASLPIGPQVCRGDKEKPLVFINAISTPFKTTNRVCLDSTSCLFVVIIHIIRTGNLPQALIKEGRKRIYVAPRLRSKELTRQIFFPKLLCGTFSPFFLFHIYWVYIACARLCCY